MKLSVERQPFLSELQLVTRAAATRSAIPALGGVMLKATGDALALSATDTEIALQSSMPADDRAGGHAAPAGALAAGHRACGGRRPRLDRRRVGPGRREGHVPARFVRRADSARRRTSRSFRPRTPDTAVQLDAGALAATIERVAKAASRDETRPVLTGILVSLEDGTLRMVATDSYRLSVKEAAVPGMNGSAFEANVPARALQELGRVVAETQPETGLDHHAGTTRSCSSPAA